MVRIFSFPFDDYSSFAKGTAFAPEMIRSLYFDGSSNDFSESGTDTGKIILWETPVLNKYGLVADYFQEITNTISAIKDEKWIGLGGDHSLSFPMVRGLGNLKPFHIIHFDAHPDLYPSFQDSLLSHACPFNRIMENQLCESLTQIGIRTMNDVQLAESIKYKVKQYRWMEDFYAAEKSWQTKDVYVSIDMDVFDPAFAPGVSHQEPGGLAVKELLRFLQQFDGNIIAADIVEYNPLKDIQYQTGRVAVKLLKELVAKMTTQ